MTTPEKLNQILNYFNTNCGRLGKAINKPQTFYDIRKGQIKNFSPEVVAELKKLYPEINESWLLFDEGEMLTNPKVQHDQPEKEKLIHPNAKQINEGEDYIWLDTYKVPEKAGLSLSSNYFAESYINELEKGKIMVKKEHAGKYWEVESTGDSMNDGTSRSLLHGDWYAARDIPREKWKDKLHLNKWNAFYFLHDTRGHIIKEVVSHDPETGIIILHSWNPDKDQYPDFEINIKDCYIVANVVQLTQRNFNIFYK